MGSSEARPLWTIGILSSLLSFVFSGADVLYTLYAINELQIDASEWSQIRASRYILTIVIVLVLGTYAEKWGQKRVAAITVALASLNLFAFIAYPTKPLLFLTSPLHAAFVSMVTMSINVLAQRVPERLQAVSNTVYRSTYTGLAIFGPLALALFADAGQRLLFAVFACLLSLCFPGFLLFPDGGKAEKPEKDEDVGKAGMAERAGGIEKAGKAESGAPASPGRRPSFLDLLREWKPLVRNKSFIRFEIGVTVVYSAFLVNMIFGPIKLIQTLGMGDRPFSYASTGVAAFTTVLILIAGPLFRTRLKPLVTWPLSLLSLGNLLLGLQSNLYLSIALYIATNALNVMSYASISIWTSRIVEPNQLGFAFTFHKVFIALFGFAFSIVLSWMEGAIGIDASFAAMGSLGFAFSLYLARQLSFGRPASAGDRTTAAG
ncbi:MFS transporter [Cohnella xylanilytica]|uniref:MFS transporter n=1 Tax=Cohnella xylanilytica TaxID=557555 RepID=A0A841TQC0_9BACL|nr:MFS transporter [Cohnella xylanilytica]MBB6690506.1 MFS transporter [Cohnella xylanilytica]